jgi:HSP20 family molecular chaperone IbpA
LPQGADVKRLKNALQPDGTLTIEIPVQDNANLRPQLSPTGLNKQFSNFSLSDNNALASAATSSSSLSSSTAAAAAAANNSLISNTSNVSGLIDQSNDGKELKLTFDLTGYKPEDLTIKVIDNNTLKVHAVHIDNSRGNQIHREYTRQYILPDGLQPELLRARMSENGTLTVEVPLPQVQPNKYERVINIQNTNR